MQIDAWQDTKHGIAGEVLIKRFGQDLRERMSLFSAAIHQDDACGVGGGGA